VTVRYVIGPAYAVVRGGAVVVLPEKVTPELVDELWTALGAGGGVVPVLEVLTGSFGASLASLPPFAMAVADGRRVQVASRGATSVTVARADGRDHVSGEGVTTWAERTFHDVVDFAVQVGVSEPDDLVDGRALPLDAGVVLVRSVGTRLTEDALPAAPVRRREPVREPWEDSEPVVAPAARRVRPDTRPDPAPAAADLVAAEATIAPEATMVPSLTVTSDDVPRPAPAPQAPAAADPVDAGPSDAPDDDSSASDDAPAAAGPAGAADELPPEETSGYDHLWGSTVHRAVEAAAIRPQGEDDDEDGAEDAGSHGAGTEAGRAPSAPDAPAGAAPARKPDAAEADRAALEPVDPEPVDPEPSDPEPVGQETVAPPVDAAPAVVAPTGADEIDGSTVLSSAIADLRAAAGTSSPDARPAPGAVAVDLGPNGAGVPPGPSFASAPQPGRPLILARSCTSGHPNPPQRDDCATCGQSLVGEARQVPRPALGVVAVSGGPRVTLDRPVVVGRRPRSPRATGDDVPRLVTVPSPQQDISRSHVEVRLEGWHVLVSDMSTTNGTTLLRSGQPPLRLHPGEPVLVVSRDVIDLGDGVTLTFEGIL